tara:strand:+ start:350 stop:607 length:258 start_codon:yes stop_codon:yes gene_type:complete
MSGGPDGIGRSEKLNDRIADAFDVTFRSEAGRLVLDYLESVTIKRTAGPEVTDQHLRHLEGQRFLVGMINQWHQLGINNRKEDTK